MTELQLKRWKQFSIRMAHHGWAGLPRKSRRYVSGMVKDYFREWLAISCEEDSTLLGRIESWDNNARHPEDNGTCGWACKHRDHLICDEVDEMIDKVAPDSYRRGWRYRKWDDLWGVRLRCCLRAGIDLASSPSMGVMGFSAGDLRQMYPFGVPEWVSGGDEPWKANMINGIVPGVGFTMNQPILNGPFASIADNQQIWI